jgi:hypothetical protein
MRKLYLLLLSAFLLNGCIKNNPDPSWLEVTEWTLKANPNAEYIEGEMTHNFTDAWVYVNDEVIGVFEVPFKIPILTSGPVNIKIYPTIRNNGISASKKIYPFVDYFEVDTILTQNATLTLHPETKYKSFTQFWLEEFEDAAIKIENDPISLTTLTKANDPAILQWGNFYGEINLNSIDSMWVGYSESMNLPRGQEVYLEVDYYNTNSLITGILGISPTEVKNNRNITINKQNPDNIKWKKIYIDLKEIVSNSPNADYFKQSFEAFLEPDKTESFIRVDNIKVVHF